MTEETQDQKDELTPGMREKLLILFRENCNRSGRNIRLWLLIYGMGAIAIVASHPRVHFSLPSRLLAGEAFLFFLVGVAMQFIDEIHVISKYDRVCRQLVRNERLMLQDLLIDQLPSDFGSGVILLLTATCHGAGTIFFTKAIHAIPVPLPIPPIPG